MNEISIHDATRQGDLCRIRQLIEAGVSVDVRNEEGETPLHLAARYGQYEVAELLINSKCDLDIRDRFGHTPVRVAAGSNRQDIVALLLHRGAQLNGIYYCGRNLLQFASSYCSCDIVRLILDNGGADLNAVSPLGRTPLMSAVSNEDEEVAVLLIQAGADVNRSNRKKETALHEAVGVGTTSMIQILLETEGLDLSPQDVYGNTPLHLACQDYDRRGAIKQLLDAGADTDVKNIQGRTALSEGIREKILTHEEVGLFVQKGAFLESCDYKRICKDHFLQYHGYAKTKENVLKDVELCTQSVVNKFNRQSLPALNSITNFVRRLPNVDNFKLGARHIDEVRNLVKGEIERNTICNVVKVRPIALSALCVLSLITFQSGKKQATSPDFGY